MRCEKILGVLGNGPCRFKELVEKTRIPKTSIYGPLNHLKRLGIITSAKRKWVIVAYTKPYKNPYEHKIHLGHSWELVKGLLAINEFLPQFLPSYDFYSGDILTEQRKKLKLRSSPEMWPYALQHLKTGYPDIFNLYEKCNHLLEQVQYVQTGIKPASNKKTLHEIARELLYIEAVGAKEDLSTEATNNIDEKSKSIPILTKEERFRLDEQTADTRIELENQLTKVIWKVVNREPLSGRCDQCPRVSIGEKSAPQKDSGSNH